METFYFRTDYYLVTVFGLPSYDKRAEASTDWTDR